MTGFKDKVAVITGGASGIGRAAALAFAREGTKVVVIDRDAAGGEHVIAEVRAGSASPRRSRRPCSGCARMRRR